MMENLAEDPTTTEQELDSPVTTRGVDPLSILPFAALPRRYTTWDQSPKTFISMVLKDLKDDDCYRNGKWVGLLDPDGNEFEYEPHDLEEKVVLLFNTILKNARLLSRSRRRFEWRTHHQVLNESHRKPNVILAPVNAQCEDGSVPSSKAYAYCEVKYTSSSDGLKDAALLQLAEFAGLVTSCQFGRRFYVAMSLCGADLTLVGFVRGANLISSPINIHDKPEEFINIILALSEADDNAIWTGFDNTLIPNEIPYTHTLYFESRVCADTVLPLFRAFGLPGKGTVASAVDITINLNTKRDVLHGVLKECWPPVEEPNDITIHQKLQSSSPGGLLPCEEASFGSADQKRVFADCQTTPWDDENHLPGIPIMVESEECMQEMPILPANWDPRSDVWVEYETRPDTTANIAARIQISDEVSSNIVNYEPRKRIRVLCRTLGVSVVFFSCRREFTNGFMGYVVGHLNGLRKRVLHRDPSPDNLWLLITNHDNAIPDLCEKNDRVSIPLRAGLLGDWGSGMEVGDCQKIAEGDSKGTVMGTMVYMATPLLLQWQRLERQDAGFCLSAADLTACKDFLQNEEHDLEGIFWAMWSLSVTQAGPYNTCRSWKPPHWQNPLQADKANPHDSKPRQVGKGQGGFPVLNPTPNIPIRPTYPSPLRYAVNTAGVLDSKACVIPAWIVDPDAPVHVDEVIYWRKTLTKERIGELISPYFREGPGGEAFKKGMQDLYAYFKYEETELPPGRERITHQRFLDILCSMRDAIPEAEDTPTKEVVKQGQENYANWLKGRMEFYSNQKAPTDDRKTGTLKRSLQDSEEGGSGIKKPRTDSS